jgi:hypothetical protein
VNDSRHFRQGSKVPLNIYQGSNPGRPICQCHTEKDARDIVVAVNFYLDLMSRTDNPPLGLNSEGDLFIKDRVEGKGKE